MSALPKTNKTQTAAPPLIFEILRSSDIKQFLKGWAGEKIFKRGKNYFERGLVKGVAIRQGERLVATVRGTKNYSCSIYVDDDGILDGDCTCPYDDICKHIVALALQASTVLGEDKIIPISDEFNSGSNKLDKSCNKIAPPTPAALKRALSHLSRDKLLELLLKACAMDKEIAILCAVTADPDKLGIQALVNDAKHAIVVAAADPALEEDYDWEPDYYDIAAKLEAIAAAGKPELALELTQEVFATCSNAINLHDCEGSLLDGVVAVAKFSVAALHAVNWHPEQKLLWAIKAALWDHYGFSELFESYFKEITDPEIWSTALGYLQGLQKRNLFSLKDYHFTSLLKLALEKAGEPEALLPLYKREALEKNDYLKLVDYLLKDNQAHAAQEWIKKGIEAAQFAFQANNLRERLIALHRNEGDHGAVVAISTEIFVAAPNVASYKQVINAATEGGHLAALKPLLFRYLMTGELPWLDASWPCRQKGTADPVGGKYPLYNLLIELAIREKRPLDALRWHDEQRRRGDRNGFPETRVAEAIKEAAPERAFAIWQQEAERLIDQVSYGSYCEAGEHISKMLLLDRQMGDGKRWIPWLQALRAEHKRKKNFLKILDKIEQEFT